MGLLDFFKSDETRDWPEYDDSASLCLRVAARELQGVRLGDAYGRLESIGRPDDRKALEDGKYRYLKLGLEVETTNERIDHFGFFIADHLEHGFAPASVDVDAPSGVRVCISSATRLEEIREVFGEPGDEDRDDDEIVWYYKLGDIVLEFEFDGDGAIEAWAIYID